MPYKYKIMPIDGVHTETAVDLDDADTVRATNPPIFLKIEKHALTL